MSFDAKYREEFAEWLGEPIRTRSLLEGCADALIAIVAQPWVRVRLVAGVIRYGCPCCGTDMLAMDVQHALHGCAWLAAVRALGIA